MPKLKIGSDGTSVASIELQRKPNAPDTWEAPLQEVRLPSGKRLSVHCEWAESGVNFSAAHEDALSTIGIVAAGPFLIRYTFPDEDEYTVALVGSGPKQIKEK